MKNEIPIGEYIVRIRFFDKSDYTATNFYEFDLIPRLHISMPVKKSYPVYYKGFGIDWLKWGVFVFVNLKNGGAI